MGAKDANARANENQTLLNYGFRFYESHRLYQGKTSLNEARIWKGTNKTISVGVADDIYVTVPRRLFKDLKAAIIVDKKITAPVVEGAKLGSIKVTLNNEVVEEKDLIALQSVEQGNIFQRLVESAMMMFEKPEDGK